MSKDLKSETDYLLTLVEKAMQLRREQMVQILIDGTYHNN